jgi:OOP family OmpA-OmpF porin
MFWSVLAIVSMFTFETPGLPTAQAELPLGSPVKHRIVLHRVYADSSESVIDAGGQALLDETVKTLQSQKGVVVIVDKPSARGRGYDATPSRRHAEAVRAYLISHGVPQEKIVLKGFGESPPRLSDTTTASGTQNSRVELYVD